MSSEHAIWIEYMHRSPGVQPYTEQPQNKIVWRRSQQEIAYVTMLRHEGNSTQGAAPQ